MHTLSMNLMGDDDKYTRMLEEKNTLPPFMSASHIFNNRDFHGKFHST